MAHSCRFYIAVEMETKLTYAIELSGWNAVKIHVVVNGKEHLLDRDEAYDLLKLVGRPEDWDKLPCACGTAAKTTHSPAKSEVKGQSPIQTEFAKHTRRFAHAFWDKVEGENALKGEELLEWIRSVHPILCCAKRHVDQKAMLDFSGDVAECLQLLKRDE